MIRFRVLGGVELRDASGEELGGVLAQPKRLALLAYLTVAPNRRFHSRDTLLGVFWPELDETRARAALSQAVYYLRQALGSDVVVSRGSEEIGIDRERLWCDAVEFEQELERGASVEAMDLYRGDLLSGLYLSDTVEWEHWLERERLRLRRRAAETAWALAESDAQGRPVEAAQWGRRALELADDEAYLRKLITLLAALGDRAGAIRLYEDFSRRLSRDLEIEVSPETRKLIARIRSRDTSVRGEEIRASAQSTMESGPQPTHESAVLVSGHAGVGKEAQGDRAQDWRRWILIFGPAAALVAIGLSIAWPRAETHKVTGVPAADWTLRNRVAVLPLAYFGPVSEDEYLADGMTEEIISHLSRLRGLRVIARTSVMPFRETDRSIADIARELDVGFVVEGSVRRAGDRVRVSVQLIEAGTQRGLWAEEYDAALGDVLDVQREIAEQVAAALPGRIEALEQGRLARTSTVDSEAYLLYLRGQYLLGKDDSTSFNKARSSFERALEIDPAYASAWSGLSRAYDRLIWARALPLREAYPRARAAAERALELDPDLAEAHASLARALTAYYWDSEGAEYHFRAAIELDPSNADAHRAYAAHLRCHGRLVQARAEAEVARDLDPLAFFSHFELVLLFFFERRYDEAIEKAESLADMGPGYPMVHFILAKAWMQKAQFEAALHELERVDPGHTFPPALATRAYIYAVTGRRAEARRTLDGLATRSSRGSAAFERAIVHIGLGENDRALDLLDQAIKEKDSRVRLLAGEPIFDPLRSEPRFATLLRQAGLPG